MSKKSKTPKLRVVKGGGAGKYLGLPLTGKLKLNKNHAIDLVEREDLLDVAEKFMTEPPEHGHGLPKARQPSPKSATIPASYYLALLEDTVCFTAPEPPDGYDENGEADFDWEDYDTDVLCSHLLQLDYFLQRKPVVELLHAGELDTVREWWIDSALNQPFWLDEAGVAHIREDTNAGGWTVDEA